jgi:diadenosine tetraphosphate (Ap4A) HIT family hydrolase
VTDDLDKEQVACPFCSPPRERVFLETEYALGIWDAYPVSPGHALLVPRRHVASWFDATSAEKGALIETVDAAKGIVDRTHQPAGYNIGINAGVAAGQTVFHLHVHLIPRYRDDVPDPRGGVRNVIPEKGN